MRCPICLIRVEPTSHRFICFTCKIEYSDEAWKQVRLRYAHQSNTNVLRIRARYRRVEGQGKSARVDENARVATVRTPDQTIKAGESL